METAGKSDRLNLRVEPELRRLFQRAADLEHQNLTAFIVEAARTRAEQTLADQDRFALPSAEFRAFMQALERRPRSIPRLRQLLSQSTILEREMNVPRTDSARPRTRPGKVR